MKELFIVLTVVILQVIAQKECGDGDVCRKCPELITRFQEGQISLRFLREKKSCGENGLSDRKFCCPRLPPEPVTCRNGLECSECPSLIDDFQNGRISLSQVKSKFCGEKNKKKLFCCQPLATTPAPVPDAGQCSEDVNAPCFIPRFEDDCGTHDDLSKIVGGEKTKPGRYPFMAIIGKKSTRNTLGDTVKEYVDQRCGGTIVNRWYVLTAAHCYIDTNQAELDKEVVTIGEYELGSLTDCIPTQGGKKICLPPLQELTPQKLILHEDYKRTLRRGVLNDIALVKLQTMIKYGKYIRPVCLPLGTREEFNFLSIRNYDDDIVDIKGRVIGWGHTTNSLEDKNITKRENTQQKVDLPILPAERCKQDYLAVRKTVSFDSKFCAGEEGKDSCNGDSGGPMVINIFNKQNKKLLSNNGESHWIQVGIVSFGPTACGEALPGVYTRVSSYMDWIKRNLR